MVWLARALSCDGDASMDLSKGLYARYSPAKTWSYMREMRATGQANQLVLRAVLMSRDVGTRPYCTPSHFELALATERKSWSC